MLNRENIDIFRVESLRSLHGTGIFMTSGMSGAGLDILVASSMGVRGCKK